MLTSGRRDGVRSTAPLNITRKPFSANSSRSRPLGDQRQLPFLQALRVAPDLRRVDAADKRNTFTQQSHILPTLLLHKGGWPGAGELRPTSRSEVRLVQAQVMRVHPETRSPAAYEDADAW